MSSAASVRRPGRSKSQQHSIFVQRGIRLNRFQKPKSIADNRPGILARETMRDTMRVKGALWL